MKATTEEWIKKAEGDYVVVCTLLKSRKPNRYDAICFHCQQCVEKYLKASLHESSVPFPRTHDLAHLLTLLAGIQPLWSAHERGLKALTDAAVEVRYPGRWASRQTAREMTAICRSFRNAARATFGIEP